MATFYSIDRLPYVFQTKSFFPIENHEFGNFSRRVLATGHFSGKRFSFWPSTGHAVLKLRKFCNFGKIFYFGKNGHFTEVASGHIGEITALNRLNRQLIDNEKTIFSH